VLECGKAHFKISKNEERHVTKCFNKKMTMLNQRF
jgi:hypothetical protein